MPVIAPWTVQLSFVGRGNESADHHAHIFAMLMRCAKFNRVNLEAGETSFDTGAAVTYDQSGQRRTNKIYRLWIRKPCHELTSLVSSVRSKRQGFSQVPMILVLWLCHWTSLTQQSYRLVSRTICGAFLR